MNGDAAQIAARFLFSNKNLSCINKNLANFRHCPTFARIISVFEPFFMKKIWQRQIFARFLNMEINV